MQRCSGNQVLTRVCRPRRPFWRRTRIRRCELHGCATSAQYSLSSLLVLQYLPIEGLASFRKATLELLLGADHPAIAEVVLAVLASKHCQPR